MLHIGKVSEHPSMKAMPNMHELEILKLEIPPHLTYSLDMSPSDYY